jgi:hypothetical protein
MYALIAVAALISRWRDRGLVRPARMPLWPLPPLVTLVGVIVALTQQTARDILIVVALFAAGLVYYYLYLHRARGDRWVPHTVSEDVEEAGAAA